MANGVLRRSSESCFRLFYWFPLVSSTGKRIRRRDPDGPVNYHHPPHIQPQIKSVDKLSCTCVKKEKD